MFMYLALFHKCETKAYFIQLLNLVSRVSTNSFYVSDYIHLKRPTLMPEEWELRGGLELRR